jgi:hypothetical protein
LVFIVAILLILMDSGLIFVLPLVLKAMLQFCSQTNSTHHNDGEALSILSFHWGGRPIVIETDGDFFSAELVLATLHHGMIASNITGNRRVEVKGGERE